MNKPTIKITLVNRIGKHGCHSEHRIGNAFDYDPERGKRCPDVDVINVFRLDIEKP